MRPILAALVAAFLLVAPAAASASPRHAGVSHQLRRTYQRAYHEVARRGRAQHLQGPGCNLFSTCRQDPTRANVKRSLEVLHHMLYVPPPPPPPPPPAPAPAPAPAATVSAPPATSTSTAVVTSAPKATVSSASTGGSCGAGYRGLYQFDCQTWQSVGGSGDPAAASPAEQRRRAEILQSQRGNAPWPVCGAGGKSLDAIAQCESGGDPHAVG